MRAPRKRRGRQGGTVPTLRHSPRLTRGRSRAVAYSISVHAGRARSASPPTRAAPRAAREGSGRRRRAAPPHRPSRGPPATTGLHEQRQHRDAGHRRPCHDRSIGLTIDPAYGKQLTRLRTSSRIAVECARRGIVRRAAHVQGSAVVDQPGPAVPSQQVRVRAVRSGFLTSELRKTTSAANSALDQRAGVPVDGLERRGSRGGSPSRGRSPRRLGPAPGSPRRVRRVRAPDRPRS